jgi:NitT/TauT family transport system permease protein
MSTETAGQDEHAGGSGSAPNPLRRAVHALAPALTVLVSLLALYFLWNIVATTWPSRAYPSPDQVWHVLLK